MSKAQTEHIQALQIELEETKAKLAASQGREAAMRAALEEVLRLMPLGQHCTGMCRPGIDEHHADCDERRWRDALADDGKDWVSPETQGVAELLDVTHDLLSALADSTDLLRTIRGDAREQALAQAQENGDAAAKVAPALAAFEKRGGK